jgi:2-phospho-L-lactate guanylyltransferase
MRAASAEGFRRVLQLPADLPYLQAEDVALVLSRNPAPPSTVLVPSRDGTGTNALLRSPADLYPSRFGVASLTLHLQEARRTGARIEVVQVERIAFDLDDPEDLHEFLRRPSDSHTWAALLEMGMRPWCRHDRDERHREDAR